VAYPVGDMAPASPQTDQTVWPIFLAKALRTFCYGYLAIVLPLHLVALGLGAGAIGLAVAGTLGASALVTFLVGRPAERLGNRAVLVGLAGLVLVAGALLATARTPALVVLAAMLGNVALSGGDGGPFMAIEQVLVSRAVRREGLTLRLSLYFLVGLVASALGALVVAAVPADGGYGLLFWLFALSGGLQALLYARLPEPAARPPAAGPRHLPSRGFIYRIAALFALDSFAGGFVLQSLLAYWLHVRFALTPAEIGATFFAQQILAALSLLIAARTSRRLGLVNTMVFSHLLSNGLLIAMGFAPTPGIAVALLLARALLSQMDIPTRQTFLMLVVQDDEREAAATVTNAGRTVAQAVSPALTGYVMQAVSLSAPFVLGGVLKVVYDLLLYDTCRRVVPVSAPERAD
jgi:MFS family permease